MWTFTTTSVWIIFCTVQTFIFWKNITPVLIFQAVVEIDCSGPDITVSPIKDKDAKDKDPKDTKDEGFRPIERASSKKGLKRRGAKRYHKSWKDAR